MKTVIAVGDSKAIKKWSGSLYIDVTSKSYFERKFISKGDQSIIQRKTELESGPGDTIQYDLSMRLRQKPIYGDAKAEGKGEALKFYTDEVKIDQMRAPVDAGGRMTRKRTLHDLRVVARARLGDYWSKFIDEMMFIYLSGARGINEDFIEDLTWVGHAGNSIQAPDSGHIMYGGTATSKGSIANTSTLNRNVIEKAAVKARMMHATDPQLVDMQPVMINGEPHFVLVMSPFQEHQVRTETGSSGWLEIQKAAASAEGKSNPIFRGSLGMINDVVLHSHESVIRFSDYGVGENLPAARAILLGRQAGVIAYGTNGGLRFQWSEKSFDHGNAVEILAGTILGAKKARFDNKDFGVCAIDSYAPDPNAAA